ncbi:hypothetical protein EXIGLDRAFT_768503 [Exidia glandulosa HHB12029]|uniref:Uncharacterized protein n=1 Tax=Exidia glandulosa HHB12029 TaxID=1314781 RepID=A0A165I6F6_EXIGL|nr:hypothetical protein EXIGLDRAFT_768503 [Exidia glandulosa HHB12029]
MSSADSSVLDAEIVYGLGPDLHAMTPDNVRVKPGAPAPDPFVHKARYVVAWVDPTSDDDEHVWVSLNSPHPGIMPPPRWNGPVDCYCANEKDPLGHLGRFGSVPTTQPRLVYPDWIGVLSDPNYHRAFIPDAFFGEGPCPLKDWPGLLTQWSMSWVNTSAGAPCFTEETRRAFTRDVTDIDDQLRDALDIPEGRLVLLKPHIPSAAATVATLKTQWAEFVMKVLDRRGVLMRRAIGEGRWTDVERRFPGLHESLKEGHYLVPPRGVWVSETRSKLSAIKEFIRVGVPVYYRWDNSLLNLPAARALAPPPELWTAPPPRPRSVMSTPTQSISSFDYSLLGSLVSQDASVGTQARRPRTPPLCTACSGTHALSLCPTNDANTSAAQPDPLPSSPAAPESAAPDSAAADAGDSDDEAMLAVDLEAVRAPGHDVNSANLSLPHNATAVPPSKWFAVQVVMPGSFETDASTPATPNVHVEVAPDTPPPNPAEPIRRPLVERMDMDAALPPRHIPTRGRPVPRLWIYDSGRAMEVLSREEGNGFTKKAIDIIYVCIARGLKFSTPVAVDDPQPGRADVNHRVPRAWMIDPASSLREKVERWEFGAKMVLRRPHAIRAAVMEGGILSRIAQFFLRDQRLSFKVGPTRPVIDYGVPLLKRVARSDNEVLHDDYLTLDEMYVLIGAEVTSSGTDTIVRSFWPTERKMLSEGYDSVWSQPWEDWFVERLQRVLAFQVVPVSGRHWTLLRPVADSVA